jgi:hypothetical protein
MAVLIFAAVAIRRHGIRPDRHPVFVCAGRTLRWKSSLGLFICMALGLDPAIYLVDCGSESGKSLAIRRNGTGAPLFKRELLNGDFLVLDEFLTADPGVRATLHLFLSGRLVMPFENESLTIQPVPLLALNPREKPTLEGRLGLSAPQIRRAIIANLDAVQMPDLAGTGEEALAAAQAHAPLIINTPAVDCRTYHRQIVELSRNILLPEAQERVDVHIIENISSGMTAFIPDPIEAIAHVGHALATVVETLGWTRHGWIESVLQFRLGSTRPAASRSAAESGHPGSRAVASSPSSMDHEGAPSSVLSLQVPRMVRETGFPSLALSDGIKGKLVWLAEETGRPVEEVLGTLIAFYRQWQKDPNTVMQLKKILSLAEDLDLTHVDVATLKEYLETKGALAQYHRTLDDLPEALRLIQALSALPTPWDWATVRAALHNVAFFLRAGIAPEHINQILAEHRRLAEMGFDESTAVAVAEALTRQKALGPRRAEVLQEMAAGALAKVDVQALNKERGRLTAEIRTLEITEQQLSESVTTMSRRLDDLQKREAEAQQRLTQLEREWTSKTEDLDVLRALRAFLLRKTGAVEAFFIDLDRVRQYRKQGRAPADYAALHLDEVRQQLLGFIQRLVTEDQNGEGTTDL